MKPAGCWPKIRCAVILKAISTALAATALASGATGATCDTGIFEGVPYSYCAVDPAEEEIRLWHSDAEGTVYGTFSRLEAALSAEGEVLGIAMNGGMYHTDRRPVGHYVEEGIEVMRLVTSAGPGNFGLLPNGVLCLTDGSAALMETLAFEAAAPACRFATQSGPMLVIEGDLHPRFREDSTSTFIRNAVGLRADGTLIFAISDAPVTFHRFARLMRDALATPDALFVDGNVSRLHAPPLGRSDAGFPMGPIIGTVAAAD